MTNVNSRFPLIFLVVAALSMNLSCATTPSSQNPVSNTDAIRSTETFWSPVTKGAKDTIPFCGQQIPTDSTVASCTTGKRMKIPNLQSADLKKLSALPNLQMLSLQTEDEVNFQHLQHLSSLTYLNVHARRAQNADALSKLNHLTHLFLHIDKTPLDYGFLKNLKQLQVFFFVEDEDAVNTSAIQKLKKLKTLSVAFASQETIDALKNKSSLESLSLHFRRHGVNLQPVASLSKLIAFHIDQLEETELQLIRRMTRLETLAVGYFTGRHLDSLHKLEKLQVLSIQGDNIENISALQNLHQLRVLAVPASSEMDLTPIGKLTNLRYLTFTNFCPLTGIRALGTLKSLRYLDISRTRVNDIETVQKLPSLRVLKSPQDAKALSQWRPQGKDKLDFDTLRPDEILYEAKMGTLPSKHFAFPLPMFRTDAEPVCLPETEFNNFQPLGTIEIPSVSYDIGIVPLLAAKKGACGKQYTTAPAAQFLRAGKTFATVNNYGFFLFWLLNENGRWKIVGTVLQNG